MSKIRRHRAGRKGATIHPDLFEWLLESDRRACGAESRAGRWIQRRVPGMSGPMADALALANGLGVRHDR
jgi:hypothetical protein